MNKKFDTKRVVKIIRGKYKGSIGYIISENYNKDTDSSTYDVKLENGNIVTGLYGLQLTQEKEKTLYEQVLDGGHAGHIGHSNNTYHLEMAQIGGYNERNRKERESADAKSIWVYAECDRPLAHFHFYRGRDRKGGGCIVLDKPMYFKHDGHNDTLDSSEIKSLVKFLNSTDPDTGLTMWKLIRVSWNQQNSEFKIKTDSDIPPYSSDMPSHS